MARWLPEFKASGVRRSGIGISMARAPKLPRPDPRRKRLGLNGAAVFLIRSTPLRGGLPPNRHARTPRFPAFRAPVGGLIANCPMSYRCDMQAP